MVRLDRVRSQQEEWNQVDEVEARGREQARGWEWQDRVKRESDILRAVFVLAGAKVGKWVSVGEVVDRLGLPIGAIADIADSLAERGYLTVNYREWRYLEKQERLERDSPYPESRVVTGEVNQRKVGLTSLALTSTGVELAQKEPLGREAGLSNSLLVNSVVNIGNNNQMMVGSPSAVMLANSSDAKIAAELRQVIALFRQALAEAELDSLRRRQAELDLKSLEVQLARKPLNRRVIRESMNSLRSLAEGVAGNAIFAALAHLLSS
jgi:hypothetical protein